MTEMVLLCDAQMAWISPFSPLSRGICADLLQFGAD
jgi:hypothetical protein